MNLFYASDISSDDKFYLFDKDESRHISKVLRKKAGDKLFLTNGKGDWFEGEIIDDNPKKTQVKLIFHKKNKKREFQIHVAIAPTKNNTRYEWFLEKATEMGIDEITPVVCRFSELKKVNIGRFQKVIIAAMKQSLQTYLPVIHNEINFKEFINQSFVGYQKYIAYCQTDLSLTKQIDKSQNVSILIGPEGGFSDEEIQQAVKSGFKPVKLSANRLRTETAGLVSVSAVHLINS
jgi:16S rRNA (uracil1498-N3)-methyltransferase